MAEGYEKGYNDKDIRGVLVIFIGMIINLGGVVLGAILQSMNIGLQASTINTITDWIVVGSMCVSITGFTMTDKFSKHFNRATIVCYIYLAANVASSIISYIVAPSSSADIVTMYNGYVASVIVSIIFLIIDAVLNIWYVFEVLSGCMGVCRENNDEKHAAKLASTRTMYAIGYGVVEGITIALLIMTFSLINTGDFINIALDPTSLGGTLVVYAVLAIILLAFLVVYIIAYIRVLMNVYKTYSRCKK